ncbi:hypothetical protein [Conexibacter woesei]|uniref:hypothetical protein n=1 Tax=Conexibacter woesei TaxID=191495 RepID=UPI0004182CCB|nr:hypothetical protein [Conexibacter woesei]
MATAATIRRSPRVEPFRGIDGVHIGMTKAQVAKALGVPAPQSQDVFDDRYDDIALAVLYTHTDPMRVWSIGVRWPEEGLDSQLDPHPIRYRDPKTGLTMHRSTRAAVRAAYHGRVYCRTEYCAPLPRTRANADGRCAGYAIGLDFGGHVGGTSHDLINTFTITRCGAYPDTTNWPKPKP